MITTWQQSKCEKEITYKCLHVVVFADVKKNLHCYIFLYGEK
jgi:hypothetical protein